MPRLTIDDLKKVKEEAEKLIRLREGGAAITVTVHMDSCGIAAGARNVMDVLLDEMAKTDRQDIIIMNSGCLGKCGCEPNVTVEVQGQAPIIYQHMDGNKMRQVFRNHVLMGEVQTDLVLTETE
jgi:NADP-reducing hydrogenase subunit HndB